MTARRRNAGQRTSRRTARRRQRESLFWPIVLSAIVGLFVLSIAWQFRTPPEPEVELPTPAAPVKVLVLNGCGKRGLAGVFGEKLRRVAKGKVDFVDARNAPRMDYPRTLVVGHEPGAPWAAYFARLIGSDSTTTAPPPQDGIEVSIILGCDFEHLLTGQGRWWETP